MSPGDNVEIESYVAARSSQDEADPFSCTLLRGSAIRNWKMWVHAIGHNLGLSHAGAYRSVAPTFEEFQDDAMMAYDRPRTADDGGEATEGDHLV